MKYRDKFNFGELPGDKERGPWKSETVPDDTLSLRELLLRFSRDSAWLDQQKRRATAGEVDDDFDSVDAGKLLHADFTEVAEHAESVKTRIADYEAQVEADKKAKAEARRKAKEARSASESPVQGDPQPGV